jgi:hypothetical protein
MGKLAALLNRPTGMRCQTGSICHPGSPLALSGRPEDDQTAVSAMGGVANLVLFPGHVRLWHLRDLVAVARFVCVQAHCGQSRHVGG